MLIRPANWNDIPGLLRLEEECFGREKFSESTIGAFIERQDSIILVAQSNGQIVGSAICMFSELKREGRIASIAVMRWLREKGIGTKLLEECERIFRSRDMFRYTLEVETINVPAIQLYLKHGYEIRGVIQDYYSFGRNAYAMEKCVREAIPAPCFRPS